MNKALLERYVDLKQSMKQAEDELKILAPEIMKMMEENDVEQIKLEDGSGTFSTMSRKTWTYSKKVDELKADLDDQKTKEEQTGIAKFKESKSLRFDLPRNKEE